MEFPQAIKNLYRHWPQHVVLDDSMPLIEADVPNELKTFIIERITVWEKKTSGAEPPYTDDPILQQYRFCNIFREFDRQTIAFHTLLNPLRDDYPLWLLNMFYCRLVARPDTIREVGLLSFDDANNKEVYERLVQLPRPKYGTPYVFPISVIQRSPTPTRELFLTQYVPAVMPQVATAIETWERASVYEQLPQVLKSFGFNLSFLWTEVLIDVAYQYPERIDLFKQFPVGPGSLPTVQALAPHTEPSRAVAMLAAQSITVPVLYRGVPLRLSAENWEGIGCEFRKYTNLSKGKGRKRLYTT